MKITNSSSDMTVHIYFYSSFLQKTIEIGMIKIALFSFLKHVIRNVNNYFFLLQKCTHKVVIYIYNIEIYKCFFFNFFPFISSK